MYNSDQLFVITPASYTATATYSGKSWGSKVTGYTATLPYSGEVTKEIPGKVQYTLVYEEITPEPLELPEPAEEEQAGVSPLAGFRRYCTDCGGWAGRMEFAGAEA